MFGWYGGMMTDFPMFGSLVALFAVWSLVWKGFALWRAARTGEKWWFMAFLVINTVGLLELLYLFIFTKGEKGLPWLKSAPAAPVKSKSTRRRSK